MDQFSSRAAQRTAAAHQILARLGLIERWQVFGRPVLVGAVAYGLTVAADIDLEIFCPDLQIEHGFAVLAGCARVQGVRAARFANHLDDPDQGLYWRLDVDGPDGRCWKVDMWSVPAGYGLPSSAALVEPLRRAQTAETRRAILDLKEQIAANPDWEEIPDQILFSSVVPAFSRINKI